MDAASSISTLAGPAPSLREQNSPFAVRAARAERPSSVQRSLDPLGFAGALSEATERQTDAERAREGAEELIAIALIQPTLKSLRDSNNAAPPFAPGDTEKTFGAYYDAEVSRRIVQASSFPLVDAVADRLTRRGHVDPFHQAGLEAGAHG